MRHRIFVPSQDATRYSIRQAFLLSTELPDGVIQSILENTDPSLLRCRYAWSTDPQKYPYVEELRKRWKTKFAKYDWDFFTCAILSYVLGTYPLTKQAITRVYIYPELEKELGDKNKLADYLEEFLSLPYNEKLKYLSKATRTENRKRSAIHKRVYSFRLHELFLKLKQELIHFPAWALWYGLNEYVLNKNTEVKS